MCTGYTNNIRHILVECNHFDQERKDIFGRRDVVESLRFHPTLIVIFLKQSEFYTNVNQHNCLYCTALYIVFYNIFNFDIYIIAFNLPFVWHPIADFHFELGCH